MNKITQAAWHIIDRKDIVGSAGSSSCWSERDDGGKQADGGRTLTKKLARTLYAVLRLCESAYLFAGRLIGLPVAGVGISDDRVAPPASSCVGWRLLLQGK
jgi:hypothetical protein